MDSDQNAGQNAGEPTGQPADPTAVATSAFGGRLLELLTGHALTMLLSIGHRTGLFEAAALGPATSVELAERAGLDERYVREWLAAMVTGRILRYQPDTGWYSLPAEHAPLLTGAHSGNIGPAADSLGVLAALLPSVRRCFTEGGGVPFAEFAAVAGADLGRQWRHIYDEHLVDGFLGAAPGLLDRLRAGARALDLGCGTGHAVNLMAREFPASRFVGLDNSADAIGLAEADRAAAGLDNAEFRLADAAELVTEHPFDLVTAFDSVHDQRSPGQVLRAIHHALAPDGVFLLVDGNFSSHLEHNLDNRYATLSYAISLLFCLPTSRVEGGGGLGAVWGRELATEMLTAAGFTEIRVLDSPRPQTCVYVCRRGAR
ncbi:MAG TPA: class I SAM-dependent methyltransferase [Pseudonocardia sp.]|nr:class I SAM-dependent methyltransferase [Pseudonocardia sp.]